MSKLIDLSGQRFGRLTVITREGSKYGHPLWLCKCDCGNEVFVVTTSLRQGVSKSCGCMAREMTSKRTKIHGQKSTRLYNVWCNMKDRCFNVNASCYSDYGGRGITVCDEWKHSAKAFCDWAMANGYTDELTLERFDVNGNYCPENCGWVSMKVQQNNKRNNHKIVFGNDEHTLSEWEDKTGINQGTLKSRIRRGWSIERALTEPVKKES